MTKRNDARFEEELTGHFKIDMRNSTNFDLRTQNLKNFQFYGLLLTKAYNVWAKKKYRGVIFDFTEDWCKFEGKMTCTF